MKQKKQRNKTQRTSILHTIKGKILVSTLPLIVVGILILMAISLLSIKTNTVSALETSMHETATTASIMMQIQLNSYKDLSIQLANDSTLTAKLPNPGDATYEAEKKLC